MAAGGGATEQAPVLTKEHIRVEDASLASTLDNSMQKAIAAVGDPEGVICALDLDETAITVEGHESCALGTSVWLMHFTEEWVTNLGSTLRMCPTDVQMDVLEICDVILGHIPARATEASLPEMASKWQSQGVTVVGVTARMSTVAEATQKQIRGMYTFCDMNVCAKDAEKRMREVWQGWPSWKGITFHRGVWYMNMGNKGKFLQVLAESKLKERAGKRVAIVFADDTETHTLSCRELAHMDDVGYTAVHYTTAAESVRKNFDYEACEEKLASLLARLYEEQDALLHDLVRRRQTLLTSYVRARRKEYPVLEPLARALL